jgi:hypothetical protein
VHADKTETPKFRGSGCQFPQSQCHPSPRTGIALGTRLGCKQTGEGTKRVMLQSIARVYDPLGVTLPLMMDAKEIFGKRAKRNIHGTFLYESR